MAYTKKTRTKSQSDTISKEENIAKANEPFKAQEETVVVKEETKKPASIVAKDIDPEQYVIVRNGFQGKLIYKSSRTGEKFVWSKFGDEQEMQLRELRNAKNSAKKFFINNWFMFDEDWIVDYLGMRQFYKNAVSIDEFDNIFSKPPEELKKMINEMTPGQKKSVMYRAMELIAAQEIDSLKTISVLESALGVDLIEK